MKKKIRVFENEKDKVINYLKIASWKKIALQELFEKYSILVDELYEKLSINRAKLELLEDLIENGAIEYTKDEYVYVLRNASFPQLVKIGTTKRNPNSRLSEINSATGVPTPFEILYVENCQNGSFVEKTVHERLSKFRVSNRKEFFAIQPEIAIQTIKSISQEEDSSLNLINLYSTLDLDKD